MLTDTRRGYGLVSIGFHWVGALLIAGLWLLGERIDWVPKAEKLAAQNLHYGVAMLALVILVPRLIWRLLNPATPMAETNSALLDGLSKVVKWALLAVIAIMLISGPLRLLLGRVHQINVFGWIIPSPFVQDQAVFQVMRVAHDVGAKVLLALVAIHVLGALKHLVINRDGVFKRMLVPAK